MKALLMNNCAGYHAGSKTVTSSLLRLAAERGIDVTVHDPRSEPPVPGAHQLVIINGEGTFHHNAPRALRLHAIARRLKEGGARLAMINAVFQEMEIDYSIYDWIAVRESLSARYVKSRAPRANVRVIPDLAFAHPWHASYAGERSGIMFIDSVVKHYTRIIDSCAAVHGIGALRMCRWLKSADELLDLMSRKALVVTGRFHGAVFAMMAGTPVLAVPSNTWKTRGLMSDVGLSACYHKTAEGLKEAMAGPLPPPADLVAMGAVKKWAALFDELADPASAARPNRRRAAAVRPRRQPSPPCTVRTPLPVVAPGASCVLVGNGPSVLCGMGSVIDSFDEVVRFNAFKTSGFEEHTGAKTTVWSTFGHGVVPQDGVRPTGVIFIHGERGNPAYRPERLWRIPGSYYVERREEIRALSAFPADQRSRLGPSSGFLVASWLLDTGVQKIALIGFDHFSKKSSKQHHYWVQKRFGKPKEHDGDAEAAIFEKWVAAGRAVYLA